MNKKKIDWRDIIGASIIAGIASGAVMYTFIWMVNEFANWKCGI